MVRDKKDCIALQPQNRREPIRFWVTAQEAIDIFTFATKIFGQELCEFIRETVLSRVESNSVGDNRKG